MLLERDEELAAVEMLLSAGGVLVIEGGAGIGKTALVDAACSRAGERGLAVLRARGAGLMAEGLDGLRHLGGIADQLMLRTGGCSGCQLAGTCRVCRPLAKRFQEAKAHGAGLHHIRRYLGHVSIRMTEHYAKVATSEIEDILQHIWVAGPAAPNPANCCRLRRPRWTGSRLKP